MKLPNSNANVSPIKEQLDTLRMGLVMIPTMIEKQDDTLSAVDLYDIQRGIDVMGNTAVGITMLLNGDDAGAIKYFGKVQRIATTGRE